MEQVTLYYATNRAHHGDNRWNPDGYGKKPSNDGGENLRFGKLTMEVDRARVDECLVDEIGFGTGNGNALAAYLAEQYDSVNIEAFEE